MKHILNSIKKYNETFIGIILFIIGFILFSSQRSATPLAGDEPFTVYFAQWPVASILEYLMADSNIPLTYYYSRGIYNDALAQLTDTVGKKIVVEEGYTRHKEGLRRALAREKIFIANSFQDLQLSLDTIKSVIFLDVYSQYIYPQNAIKYNCEQVYGAPKTVVDLGNGIMIYRYEKEELYLNLK